jgi:hypothetical protein
MPSIKACYIGHDDKFYQRLQAAYQEFAPRHKIVFSQTNESNFLLANRLADKILGLAPDILIVDLTSEANRSLLKKFVDFISQTGEMDKKSIIGYLGNFPSNEEVTLLLEAGFDFLFCKKPDLEDCVYHSINNLTGTGLELPRYYTVPIDKREKGLFTFRVGYCSDDMIHVETDLSMPINTLLNLRSFFYRSVENFLYLVKKCQQRDLYYKHLYGYHLKFDCERSLEPNYDKIVGQFKVEKARTAKRYAYRELTEKLTKLQESKKSLEREISNWITMNSAHSMPKNYRVMVIDEGLQLFHVAEEDLDIYPFSIRVHKYLTQEFFTRETPDIVVWVFSANNNIQQLKKLGQMMAKDKECNPSVIVFNSLNTQEEMVEHTGIKQLIVDQDDLTLDLVVHYHALLEDTDFNAIEEMNNRKVYFDKSMKKSLAFYSHDITIHKINELSIEFECTLLLEKGHSFILEGPVRMGCYVISRTKGKHAYLYKAFLFGLDETQVKKLRIYLNKKEHLLKAS